MMNTTIEELKNQKEFIHKNFLKELELSYSYYKENEEEEFLATDYYYKFLLFSLYRAIESFIKVLAEERKSFSEKTNFYIVLFKDLKSYFLSKDMIKLILDDLSTIITYHNIFDFLTSNSLLKEIVHLKSINDIKPFSKNKDNSFYNDHFFEMYIDCSKNRNKLMHSNISDIDLTLDTIKDAFLIYSFLYLLLESIL